MIKHTPVYQSLMLTLLTAGLFPGVAGADSKADIDEACERQSIFTASQIRELTDEELSSHDIRMIKLGAFNACKDTYRRLAAAEDLSNGNEPASIASEEKPATKQGAKNGEGGSILEWFLSTESKEPINPMQKKHRTGGK